LLVISLHTYSLMRMHLLTIKFRDSMYYTAVEQIRLHKEFDNYLSSGELDHSMDEFISSKDEFVEDLIRDESTMAQFSDLNHALLKLSLEVLMFLM
jgi:hypothetical protein